MAETSGFFNAEMVEGDGSTTYDRIYYADQFAYYFSKFISNGVYINPATQLKVTSKGELKLNVAVGDAFINGYWYKNETLIDRLGITSKEQKYMKTIIGLDEKYDRKNEKRRADRRNENGLTNKQQELQDLKNKVESMKDQGYSLRSIAKDLNISLGKVQRVLKK